MRKINYTSKASGASIKLDNDGNSGNNIILPELTRRVLDKIINDNDLYVIDGPKPDHNKPNITCTTYKSYKYSGTVVKIIEDIASKPQNIKLVFKGRIFIDTFIAIDIPKGYDFDIRNRSGNFKRNINVTCGLIDNPYTGSMGLQISTYDKTFTEIEFSTSISQIVIKKVYKRCFNFIHLDDFQTLKSVLKKAVKRGSNGFGSTGKK